MLGPNVDDGYYVMFALNEANGHGIGYWIGDFFRPVFFVFPTFSWIYSFFFKFFDASEIGFGAYEFRIGQLIFLFVFPLILGWWIKALTINNTQRKLLLITALLACGPFFQGAITVRPEIFGLILFLISWKIFAVHLTESPRKIFALIPNGFCVGLGLILHPIFLMMNFTLLIFMTYYECFLSGNKLKYKTVRTSMILFGVTIPLSVYAVYCLSELEMFWEQTFSRSQTVASSYFEFLTMTKQTLSLTNEKGSVFYYLYAGYPIITLWFLILTSIYILMFKWKRFWKQTASRFFLILIPAMLVTVLWLPPYAPYLLIYNFIFALFVVSSLRSSNFFIRALNSHVVVLLVTLLSLGFIFIHSAKTSVSGQTYLNANVLRNSVQEKMDNRQALLLTNYAAIMPPLVATVDDRLEPKLKMLIFSPHKPTALERAISADYLKKIERERQGMETLFASQKKNLRFEAGNVIIVDFHQIDSLVKFKTSEVLYEDRSTLVVSTRHFEVIL